MHVKNRLALLAAVLLAACSGSPFDPALATRIVAVEPSGGAVGVNPSAPIVITFSHAMREGMEEYAALHEGDVTGPVVAGTWTWSQDRTQLTFTPAAPLEAQTKYTLHMGGGMRDAIGRPINYEYCLSHGGQWATQQMMGGQNMTGRGWRHQNGTYGMVFTFTTA
jgi:hypothetical protein